MQTPSTPPVSNKNLAHYLPQSDADVVKLAFLFIQKKRKEVILLLLIWIPILTLALVIAWLIYMALIGSSLTWILASLWASAKGGLATDGFKSGKMMITTLLIASFLWWFVTWLIFNYIYFIYHTSILYLIKGFIYQDPKLTPFVSIQLAFSKYSRLAIIYFWWVIYTILIPLLPYFTWLILALSWASPALFTPFILIGITFMLIYGIYIIVKTAFVLIYPVDKERRDGNVFFEALDFVKGYWLYTFSMLVVFRTISFIFTNLIFQLHTTLTKILSNEPIQLIITVIVTLIVSLVGPFMSAGRYFIFKRIEQQKLAQKNV